MSRSQVTIFAVAGIALVVAIGFIMYAKSGQEPSQPAAPDISAAKAYAADCMKKTLEQGMEEHGIADIARLEDYMRSNIGDCTDFSSFPGVTAGDFDCSIAASKRALSLEATFPLTMASGESAAEISDFVLDYPLQNTEAIKSRKTIYSPNMAAWLSFPSGIKFADPHSEDISITIRDSSQYQTPYEMFAGGLVYHIEPHGAMFSDYVQLSIKYDESLLNFPEEKLQASYYIDHDGGAWVAFRDYYVDTEKNIVHARTNHFSTVAATADNPNTTGGQNTNTGNVTNASCRESPSGPGQSNVFSDTSCCLIDWNTGGPCPQGTVNCDCYSSCSTDGSDGSACLGIINRGTCSDGTGGAQGQEFSCGSGFLWKPESEKDGNLVILLPSYYNECCDVSIYPYPYTDGSGLIEQGDYQTRANGDRPHYRFGSPGGSYCGGGPCSAVVTCGGITDIYYIPDTGDRCE